MKTCESLPGKWSEDPISHVFCAKLWIPGHLHLFLKAPPQRRSAQGTPPRSFGIAADLSGPLASKAQGLYGMVYISHDFPIDI